MMIQASPVAAVTVFLWFAITFPVSPDTLSLDQYVRLALAHAPKPRQAAGEVAASRAAKEKALSGLLPHLNASAGVSRTASGGLSPGGFAAAPGNNGSVGIEGKALLFDFGKTGLLYKASGKAVEASKHDLRSVLQSTALDARTAYFDALLADALFSVNTDALRRAEAHYDQAATLYKIGKSALFAVTKASVDVANARVGVIRAENARKLARAWLETAAGTPLHDPLVLTDSLGAPEDSIGLDYALFSAGEYRPELLSAQTRVEAARIQLKAARALYFPSLQASAGYEWRQSDASGLPTPDWSRPGWNFGAALSVPLFQGGAVHAGVVKADAELQQALAQLDQAFLSIRQEVRQYFFDETEARQRIAATAILVEHAVEGLRMSQERFKAGAAAPIEITDAEVTLADARGSHVQAQFDFHVAHAKLLASIGALYDGE